MDEAMVAFFVLMSILGNWKDRFYFLKWRFFRGLYLGHGGSKYRPRVALIEATGGHFSGRETGEMGVIL